jgi:hypothetical protein
MKTIAVTLHEAEYAQLEAIMTHFREQNSNEPDEKLYRGILMYGVSALAAAIRDLRKSDEPDVGFLPIRPIL